jgi:hypothetical protein
MRVKLFCDSLTALYVVILILLAASSRLLQVLLLVKVNPDQRIKLAHRSEISIILYFSSYFVFRLFSKPVARLALAVNTGPIPASFFFGKPAWRAAKTQWQWHEEASAGSANLLMSVLCWLGFSPVVDQKQTDRITSAV